MSDINSNPSNANQDPYSFFGLQPGASFEEVQIAKSEKLKEIGDDPILKAKIESCYDALLMDSLKARQLGKISNEAVNASQREKTSTEIGGIPGSSLLTRFQTLRNKDNTKDNTKNILPNFSILEGQSLAIRLSIGFLALVILLISPDQNIDLILSLATIGSFISQVKQGKSLISSLGWSVVFLSMGLIIGQFLVLGPAHVSEYTNNLSVDKIESIPALIMLWISSLFIF